MSKSNIRQRIWSSVLIRNVVYLGLASLLIFILLLVFLRVYTNHGQKLVLPDFKGMAIDDALALAEDQDFELIIDDSVHIVGKPGGEILAQNPKAEAGVKEGRKVYVTIAKYKADRFLAERMPQLYGQRFDLKAKELETLFKIKSKIIGYAYDPGPRDHILEVQYQGKPIENAKGKNKKVEIAKGDELGFVLSKRDGGKVDIPDLKCNSLEAGKFLCQAARLTIGEVREEGEITDLSNAYIYDQIPKPGGDKVPMGTAVQIFITQEKPTDCP